MNSAHNQLPEGDYLPGFGWNKTSVLSELREVGQRGSQEAVSLNFIIVSDFGSTKQ